MENLKYRKNLINWGYKSRQNAEDLWCMCRRDPLFFFNTFCWTYDPRRIGQSVVPFITYPFQDDVINGLIGWIFAQQHGSGKKSRDVGFTWIACGTSSWLWNFYDDLAILFASRKADYVDKTGDPRTIFWKLDFIVDWLPAFLRPPIVNRKGEDARAHMIYRNFHTGSVMSGESTNEDLSRGDRRTVIWLDEFASVPDAPAVMSAALDASGCVIPFSTPKGSATEFAALNKKNSWGFMYVHWSEHPEKAAGLYRVGEKGEIEILDKAWHEENPGYEFKLTPGLVDGFRSPWYDRQAEERSQVQLAQEVDGDDAASGSQFFDAGIISRLMEDTAIEPVRVGELIYDTEEYEPKNWFNQKNGRLRLWAKYDDDVPPKTEEYSMGVDIAVGTGASNTVFTVTNKRTTEVEAEFASSNIKPIAAAEYAVSLCRWFNGAFMVPEANGPGREFVDRVIELGYGNIFMRRKEESLRKKSSDVAGWFSGAATKRSLLAEYGRALETGEMTNRSRESLEECGAYVITPNGVEHDAALNNVKRDPTGAKANHGDRVISSALSWKGVTMAPFEKEEEKHEYSPGTVGYRFQQRQEKREREMRELLEY